MKKRILHPPILPTGTQGTVTIAMSAAEFSEAVRGAEEDGYPSVEGWLRYLAAERRVVQALARRRRDRLDG